VERSFSWTSIAQRTLGFYRDLAESRAASGATPPPAPGAPEGVDSPIA
jgi:hypothetical protein